MQYTVYADINCPFCFALNERFSALGLATDVDWRPVQHAPDIASSRYSFESLSELTAEVMEVRRRVPSLNIVTPPFRPNTALASGLIAEAARIAPDRATRLRTLVYEALWQSGQDISDPGIACRLADEAGLDGLVISEDSRRRLAAWQQEWEAGGFDRNIPVTLSSGGNSLIGLPALAEQNRFFLQGRGLDTALSTVCSMAPRQKILLFDRGSKDIRAFIEQMGNFDIVVVKDPAVLDESINGSDGADLVVVDMDTLGKEWETLCRGICMADGSSDVPVVLVTRDSSVSTEAAAFQAGASDVLRKPYHPVVVRARLGRQLEMIRSRRSLENMARIDSLTRVHNRRQFDISLQSEWRRCRRAGTPLSLLMIDIDHFKKINDHYGHDAGDDCLRSVAGLLHDTLQRPDDRLARYGGEEFAVILSSTGHKGAVFMAENCRAQVAQAGVLRRFSDDTGYVTVSVGHATIYPADGQQPEQLVYAADQALYEAKAGGRNCTRGAAGCRESLVTRLSRV